MARTQQIGFTLLEVMVALAILAVVAVSASQASRSYLQSVHAMQTRTLAHFVAQNTLANMRIQQTFPTSPSTQQIDAQAQQWQVSVTPSENLDNAAQTQPITISVAPIQNGTVQHSITSLEATLLKPDTQNPALRQGTP